MGAIRAQGVGMIQRAEELAVVPLNMTGLNPALVREASYIVNAQGGCNDCHNVPSYAVRGDPLGQSNRSPPTATSRARRLRAVRVAQHHAARQWSAGKPYAR